MTQAEYENEGNSVKDDRKKVCYCPGCEKEARDKVHHLEHKYVSESQEDYMKEASNGSPIINMVPDGGGRDNGYGLEGALAGILPLAFLAPLLKGGFGGNEGGRNIEAVIADQVGNLRHDVAVSEIASLKQAFEADKDAVRAGFDAKIAGLEAKLETERAVAKLEGKIGECCEQTGNKLFAIEKTMDDKFCGMKAEMLKGFADCRDRELHETIRIERERNVTLLTQLNNQTIVTSILTALGVTSPVLSAVARPVTSAVV